MAQGRMLGGCFGTAASSTVIPASKKRRPLLESDVLTSQELKSLHDVTRTIFPERWQLIRGAYTDIFDDMMLTSAVFSGVCSPCSVRIWQKSPPSMEVKRQQQGIYGAWRKNLTAKKKAGKASRLDIPIQEKAEETAVVDLLTQDKS